MFYQEGQSFESIIWENSKKKLQKAASYVYVNAFV